MSTCGILFAKRPEPGRVKTRLQPWCGASGAATLYSAFIQDCADLLAASSADSKVVAYTPTDARGEMADLLADIGDFELVAQPELDLGGRMEQMARWSFSRGAQRTVIVGSDSPSLPVDYIDRAFVELERRDLVLGPSTDGGYYLIGLRAGDCGALFSGVEWSTGSVMTQTLARLGGRSLALLPVWYDVDTPPEAGLLKVHLEGMMLAGEKKGSHSLELLRAMEPPAPS